ncbi:hypothetical protein [Enterococcus ureasiticus]|nr:hypothetical protein [Enterococcus ureasiticus]
MEGLCQIWATAIAEGTREMDRCPKMLQPRVKEILEEFKEAGE